MKGKLKITNLIDIRQTPQYSAFMKSLGWKTVFYKKSQIYIKKLPLLPLYVGKMLHSHSLCCQKEIIEVRRKYSLIQFSYEPFFIEKEKYGRVFWQINSDSKGLIPTKTLWLNLDNNNLLNNLKAKTRYNLKRASKRLDFELIKGCEVKKDQLDKILALWSVNKPYTKLFPAPKQEFINLLKTFDKKCFIVRSFEKHNLSKTLAFWGLSIVVCKRQLHNFNNF